MKITSTLSRWKASAFNLDVAHLDIGTVMFKVACNTHSEQGWRKRVVGVTTKRRPARTQ